MAYQATHWAWEIDLPMTQKFVLIALADMADESLSCYPGQKRIAKMIGSSERTVRRALADLEEWKLIEREERRAADGYRTSDRYILKTKKKLTGQIGRKSNRPNSPRTMTTVSPVIDDSLTGHSDRAIEQPVNNQRTTSSNSAVDLFELEKPAEGDLFDSFWLVWPRKDGKKAAEAAWAKALTKINQHAILAAATAYANSPYRPERKFVPFASTWLNQERWADGPPLPPEMGRGASTPTDRALAIMRLGQQAPQPQKAVGA